MKKPLGTLLAILLLLALSLPLATACGGETHTHTWSDSWTRNETYHWRAATCGHDVSQDLAKHTFGADGVCTICGWSSGMTPDASTPSLSETYMKDATGVFVKGTDLRVGYDFLPAQDYATKSGGATLSQKDLDDLRSAEDIIGYGHADVPVYGIYAGAAHEYLNFYQSLDEMGVVGLRTNYSSSFNDAVMDAFCESGISVMLTTGVTFGSTYYRGNAGMVNTDSALVDMANYNFTAYLEAVADNITTLLSVYGPRGSFFCDASGAIVYDGNYNPIRYIEVQNEPNFQYLFAVKRPDGSDDAYNTLKHGIYALEQIVTYYTVKSLYPDDEGHPQVYVVGMGAGGVNGLDQNFIRSVLSMSDTTEFRNGDVSTGYTLKRILNDAIAASPMLQEIMGVDGTTTQCSIDTVNTMDILSTHPYIDGKFATSPFARNDMFCLSENIRSIRALLAEGGKPDMPIWFTECGWNVLRDEGGLKSDGKHTQLEQAYMEVQFYLYALRNGIGRVAFMSIIDTDGCNYGQFQADADKLGDGSSKNRYIDADWRLACYAIQTMTKLLPDPALAKILLEDATKGLAYEFVPYVGAAENVTVVLSPLAKNTVTIPWTSSDYVLMTDLFGAEKIVRVDGGVISVDAGPNVVYLRNATRADLVRLGVAPATTASLLPLAWHEERREV